MSLKAFFLLAILFLLVILFVTLTSKQWQPTDSFKIYGKLIGTKKSGNHSFGIISLSVDSIENGRIDTIANEWGKPYWVNRSYAEVFSTIAIGAENADKVIVDVPKKTVAILRGDSAISAADLYFITDENNLDFIRKHSLFNIGQRSK